MVSTFTFAYCIDSVYAVSKIEVRWILNWNESVHRSQPRKLVAEPDFCSVHLAK